MEFWKCLNEGKSLFLPEVLELPVDEVVNSRNKVSSGHELESLYDDTSNYPLMSNQESIQFGFRQANCNDLRRNGLSDQIGLDCYTEVVSQDKELRSRMPSLFSGSDSLELATVDLKLGGLADSMCSRDGQSSKSAASVKRSRLTSSYSHAPVCQVHGCNKDLSSFKDYYKRHKVCDAHTKTAKVFVKGIEQRFCQQCSRFHLLAEFDDGKRSCRKRLANHNERRRKSPGTRFLRSSSMRTSFLFPEMLPTEISCPSKQEPGKWYSDMKFEDPILDSNSLLNFHDNISNRTIDESVRITVPNVQDSSRALSLLSSQSLKDSNPLLGTQMSNPYSSAQGFTYSEKIGPSGDVEDDLKVPDDSFLFGSDTSNNKYCHSSGQGTVMDLMQLSSHLQMVERKRNLMH